jgi:hypothetical protein
MSTALSEFIFHFALQIIKNVKISFQIIVIDFYGFYVLYCRSQWPRGLRHELAWPASTLGSWVRITLKAWMFVCVSSAFVQVAALRRPDPPSKESYRMS